VDHRTSGRETALMFDDFIYSFVICFIAASLFVFVDWLEPNRTMAGLMKFLVLFVSGVAVMHKLRPYGLSLF
jgi:hypothetical protein